MACGWPPPSKLRSVNQLGSRSRSRSRSNSSCASLACFGGGAGGSESDAVVRRTGEGQERAFASALLPPFFQYYRERGGVWLAVGLGCIIRYRLCISLH